MIGKDGGLAELLGLQSLSNKTVLVSGASSGIGFHTAKLLAPFVKKVFVTARRAERLQVLAKEHANIEAVSGDMRDEKFLALLAEKGALDVDILVNNAGLAKGLANTWEADETHWHEMIATNVTACFLLSKRVVPFMLKKGGGHIIHMASVASHVAYAKGGVYCGTKHAVLAFSKALRSELCEHNIKVSHLSPGMTETEFSLVRFDGDQSRADSVYLGVEPLTGLDVARQVVFCLLQPWHVNIDEIYLTPLAQGEVTKVFRKVSQVL